MRATAKVKAKTFFDLFRFCARFCLAWIGLWFYRNKTCVWDVYLIISWSIYPSEEQVQDIGQIHRVWNTEGGWGRDMASTHSVAEEASVAENRLWPLRLWWQWGRKRRCKTYRGILYVLLVLVQMKKPIPAPVLTSNYTVWTVCSFYL